MPGRIYKGPWTEAPGSSLTEMFYAFIAWAAKFESDRKSERVRAAHARLRQQGKHMGRPKGSKDTSTRKKGGYYLRWQSKKYPVKMVVKIKYKSGPENQSK